MIELTKPLSSLALPSSFLFCNDLEHSSLPFVYFFPPVLQSMSLKKSQIPVFAPKPRSQTSLISRLIIFQQTRKILINMDPNRIGYSQRKESHSKVVNNLNLFEQIPPSHSHHVRQIPPQNPHPPSTTTLSHSDSPSISIKEDPESWRKWETRHNFLTI